MDTIELFDGPSNVSLSQEQMFDPAHGLFRLPEEIPVGQTDWVDWREQKNRMQAFLDYYGCRRISHDLDHTHYYTTYASRKNLDFEQSSWLALLFGQTYKVAQATAYFEAFPDFHSVTEDEFLAWNAENWGRTSYGTDVRYNKGHFAEQAISIKRWLGGKTFAEKINPIVESADQDANFFRLYEEICKIERYGRMTAWLTSQALWDITKIPINARTILIDDPANWSPYNGVMILYGLEHLMAGKHNKVNPGYKPSLQDRKTASSLLEETWQELEKRYPEWEIDGFRLETCLCQYKKLFTGVEYIGHASGDACQSYVHVASKFPEVNLSDLRAALETQHPTMAKQPRIKMLNTVFKRYGVLLNAHILTGVQDEYEMLGIRRPEVLF
jgi:hypothetical protein